MSPSENLPTLWLLYETREPHLLRNTVDGTPITCIYQSIEHGVKRGTIRIPSQSMDDLGKFEEGSDFCIRFGGPRTPADIARTGYRARLKKLEKNLLFGDLTDEDAQHMGYVSADALFKAKALRYPIIKKIWKPETLHITRVQFGIVEKLQELAL